MRYDRHALELMGCKSPVQEPMVSQVAASGKGGGATDRLVGELMKLGVGERHAVKAGMSRKAYWHLAKTEALNVALSNAYLKEQGLTSIRTLWIRIHHSRQGGTR